MGGSDIIISMLPTCTLDLLPEMYSVYRYPPDASIPFQSLDGAGLWALARTPEEVSLVCSHEIEGRLHPQTEHVEAGWRALKVIGPLDFSQVGILASIAGPLAAAGVSIFTISTFDTDYILIKEDTLDKTLSVLEKAGHQVFVRQS
jgi:uncharacterized protein